MAVEPTSIGPQGVIGFLEKYKVIPDWFAALISLFGLAAVVISALALKSSFDAANAARRSTQIQESEIQPLFLVYLDEVPRRDATEPEQRLRLINLKGTFLKVSVKERSFLSLGSIDERSLNERVTALIPVRDYWTEFTGVDPKGRGTQIRAWKARPTWLDQTGCSWAKYVGDSTHIGLVKVVTFIQVNYVDITRKEQTLYFRVAGNESNNDQPEVRTRDQLDPCKQVALAHSELSNNTEDTVDEGLGGTCSGFFDKLRSNIRATQSNILGITDELSAREPLSVRDLVQLSRRFQRLLTKEAQTRCI